MAALNPSNGKRSCVEGLFPHGQKSLKLKVLAAASFTESGTLKVNAKFASASSLQDYEEADEVRELRGESGVRTRSRAQN